jgi:hypothetical protein
VLVALIARIVWAVGHGQTIEQEGAEYARIAENLLAGHGYVGIFNNGVQLNFPPLYPLMIAMVSYFTGDAEIAARAINITLGAALVIPVFKIAELVHGKRVAVVAAVLVVCHPVLIAGSASTYSENAYLTVMMFGLLYVLRCTIDRRVSTSCIAGLFLGAAYLIRPEAFLWVGLFTIVLLITAMFVKDARRTVVASLALSATFAAVAAPNIVFLSTNTGQLRIEAKGTLAYQWGQRINQGMSYPESVAGIGPDLSDQGVFMRPNVDVLRSADYSLREYTWFVLNAAKKNVAPIIRTLSGESALGSPCLFALVVLGVFGSTWSRERLQRDGVVVIYALMFVLVLLTVQELWFRYLYAVVAMLLFWGAKGSDQLGVWGQATVRSVVRNDAIAIATGESLKWLAVLLLLGLAFRGISSIDQFDESMKPARKEAGLWIARQPHATLPVRVMSWDLQVPYYAHADMMLLPYANSDRALAYIEKHAPDYIVLTGGSPGGLPYTNAWFADGIPSTNAQLVYDQAKPASEHIKIYRWIPTSVGPFSADPSTAATTN